MMRNTKRVRQFGLLVVCMVVLGCSSTAQPGGDATQLEIDPADADSEQARQPRTEALDPDGTDDERHAETVAPSPVEEQGESPAEAGRPPPESPRDDATPISEPTAPAPQGPPARHGRGIDEHEIKIGIEVHEEIDYTAFGAEGSSGDQQFAAQAVVDHINRNGGIAGRQIVPTYHHTDVNRGTFDQQAERACARFTQDVGVFAAIPIGNAGDAAACYAAHNTVYVTHKGILYETAMFDRYRGSLYLPAYVSGDRWARIYIDGLAELGFFEDAVLGFVRYDSLAYDRVTENVFYPRLAAHGVEIEEEVQVTNPNSIADLGDIAAQSANAILRFRTRGVTHVIFGEVGGALPFLFMSQAESQGYRPRYGFSSANRPRFQETNVPVRQLQDAVGVGWAPVDDVERRSEPGNEPATERCLTIFDEAGVDYAESGGAYRYMIGYCDTLFFLKAALDRAAPDLTGEGMLAAVEGLGTSYDSAMTFATQFGPNRYEGPAAIRRLAFDDDCTCFRYTSPLIGVNY